VWPLYHVYRVGPSNADSSAVADVTTGTIQQVAAGISSMVGLYSPDDSLLLVAGSKVVDNMETDRTEIWVANADGSAARQVVEGTPLRSYVPNVSAWRPAV